MRQTVDEHRDSFNGLLRPEKGLAMTTNNKTYNNENS